MDVKTADSAYFVHGSARGLVFGPRNKGRDDHITVGFDDGEISEAHRKVNGNEEWRVTPEGLQAEVESLVANHAGPVEFASVSKPGTYIVSFNRIRVLFAIPQALVAVAMPLLWRLIATKKVAETATGQRFEVSVEQRKLKHLIARLGGPLSILEKLLRHLPAKVPLRVLRLVGRWTCVHPSASAELEGGVFFVVSKDHVGLLWRVDSGALQYLPVAPLLDLYLRAERNLPMSSLSELGNNLPGGVTFTGRSW